VYFVQEHKIFCWLAPLPAYNFRPQKSFHYGNPGVYEASVYQGGE